MSVTISMGGPNMTDWTIILRDYGPLVWRTVRRLLDHDADANDCFQRTFLSAIEWAEKEPIRNWPAVLRRLATARALEMLRSRFRNVSRNDRLPETAADHRADDPIDSAMRGELAERLRDALAWIDPVQAEAFCLICLEELTNREAAEVIGVTANHAGVLLHRARQALREKLIAFDPAIERRGNL